MKQTDLILSRLDDIKESHSKRLDKIDINLKEHMKRTELLEDRADKLELPIKLINLSKQVILYIGTIVGLILSVLKLKELI